MEGGRIEGGMKNGRGERRGKYAQSPLFVITIEMDMQILVSCPILARLLVRNDLVNEVKFLGLITQME